MNNLELYLQVIKLKEIKRTGWLYKDVPSPESVADHSFGVAFLALTIDLPEGIDRDKLIKMAVLHDIGESVIGNIVWESGINSNQNKQKNKHEQEKESIKKLLNQDENLKQLAVEYLEGNTKTAHFLKELNKIEMVYQALKYEKKVSPSSLDEFWDNANKYIKSKEVRKIYDELLKKRKV